MADEKDPLAALGKNNVRKSHETGKSAKDEIRRVLGSPGPDGKLLDYTIEELSQLTKKSEINVRTMISDLRSAKYCGRAGIFLTERIKRPDGETSYRYVPPGAYKDPMARDVPGLKHGEFDGRGMETVPPLDLLPGEPPGLRLPKNQEKAAALPEGAKAAIRKSTNKEATKTKTALKALDKRAKKLL